jgi:hypothetical protein
MVAGMTTSSHRDRALDHLGASLAAHAHLTGIYETGEEVVSRQTIAQLNEAIRLGIKLAQVEALLDIAAAVREA